MNNHPIIFLHTGNPPFLTTAIDRLRLNNDAEIILLGDESNKNIKGVSHYNVKDFFGKAQKFEDISYLHMSSNSYRFELICYQRWFVIEEFISNKNYELFWYLDSDVLVFDNLSEYINTISDGKSYDLIGFDTANSGPGDSFMPAFNCYSPKLISEITSFFNKSYTDPELFKILRDKWRKHSSEKIAGGICDMTQLKLFFDQNGKNYNIFNSYALTNASIPDGNINSTFNYTTNETKFKMLYGIKHVVVENYKVFGYLENGEKVQFVASHFQSRAKSKMVDYSKENYNPTSIKTLLYYKSNLIKVALLKPIKKIVKAIIA